MRVWAILLVGLILGCEPPVEEEWDGEEDPVIEPSFPNNLKGDYPSVPLREAQHPKCSTQVAERLSLQVIQEMRCMGVGLKRFSAVSKADWVAGNNPADGLVFNQPGVVPYLDSGALTKLYAVGAKLKSLNDRRVIRINSAFRTVVQQYLLYKWKGSCGLSRVALPGYSNHEDGRALDIANFGEMINTMRTNDWKRAVPRDPVHFQNDKAPDLTGVDVRAFQRLWNRAHPEETIPEDGIGWNKARPTVCNATCAALRRAPTGGFPSHAVSCDLPPEDAIDGEDVPVTDDLVDGEPDGSPQ